MSNRILKLMMGICFAVFVLGVSGLFGLHMAEVSTLQALLGGVAALALFYGFVLLIFWAVRNMTDED